MMDTTSLTAVMIQHHIQRVQFFVTFALQSFRMSTTPFWQQILQQRLDLATPTLQLYDDNGLPLSKDGNTTHQ